MSRRGNTGISQGIPANLQSLAAAAFALLLFALMAATLSFAQSDKENDFGRQFNSDYNDLPEQKQTNKNGSQYREGTKLIDRLGHFQVQGDQVFFSIDDDQHRFNGLPNLNLERVARAITDDAAELEWSVTGTITEYRGANYLLVERAVLKTKIGRGQRRE